jgi:hypothetical protein
MRSRHAHARSAQPCGLGSTPVQPGESLFFTQENIQVFSTPFDPRSAPVSPAKRSARCPRPCSSI